MECKYKIRRSIFIPMILIFTTLIIIGIISPKEFFNIQNAISNFQYDYFAWLYVLVAINNLVVLAWLGLSSKGHIILGGKDSKPIMSRWSWFSITVCAGIGTGIIFWGIAEPIYHLHNGVPGTDNLPNTPGAALDALSVSMIHWGFVAYGHYAIFGVVLGFAIHNLNLPHRISSALYPILGKKSFGILGDIIDLLSLFAISVSISAILAVATLQFGSGLKIFNIEPEAILYAGILFCIVFVFIFSSYSGLLKGIRYLSLINVVIFIAILSFIFIFGNSKFVLFFSVEAFGESISSFIHRLTFLSSIEENKWPMWWSIVYWIWMIVYSPMVGLFLAKIAKGRSIREFILMNLVVPSFFVMIWFGIFGSNAIKIDFGSGVIWNAIQLKGLESSVFEFLNYFPLTTFMSIIFMISLLLSVVTISDSMTSTISSLSIRDDKKSENKEAPKNIKIFWGIMISVIAFLSIVASTVSTSNSIDLIQSTKLLPMMVALPILFLFVALIISAIKMFAFKKNE